VSWATSTAARIFVILCFVFISSARRPQQNIARENRDQKNEKSVKNTQDFHEKISENVSQTVSKGK
jgi:hypothetical protein